MSNTLRAATSISGLTLLSRILGLVRDSLMMRVLGVNWVSGAFLLAWMFPNLFRRLFGEGALSASFIPAYASTLDRQGSVSAGKLLARVSGSLITALGVLTVLVLTVCWILPPGVLGLGGGEDVSSAEAGGLLLGLSTILFPYVMPICLVALYAGALNSLGSFALPAAAPVVLNCFWIAGLVTAMASGMTELGSIAFWIAGFLLCGGLAQLGLMLVALHRRRALPRPVLGFPNSDDPARAVFRSMLPTLIGLSAVQASALMDQVMAVYLVEPGANNYIYLANRLFLFPHALTAVAVATAVFPSFAMLASDDRSALRSKLDGALTGSLFFALPAAVGLMLIAGDLVEVLFQHGRFTAADTEKASLAALLLVIGLPFVASTQLHARAFYALGDMTTPARIALRMMVVNLGLNLVLVLGTNLGAAGLTLATSLAAMGNAISLRRRLPRICPAGAPLLQPIGRSALATAAMALAVWGVRDGIVVEGTWDKAVFDLCLPVGVGIGVYALAHWILRSPELSRLRRRR